MTQPVTPRCYNQCMHTRYSPARVNLFLLLLGMAFFSSQVSAGAQSKGIFTGIVTHVADGDTLSVTANGRTEKVRLEGIDAPEAGQAFGGQARQRLRVLAFSQPATVHVRDRDRYGRLVARVIVAGRDLSEEMVKAGLAWHYTQYSADRQLAALEQQARQQQLGLWADRAAVAPWQYRKDHSRGAPGPHTPGVPPVVSPASGPFHGNVSSHVYHASGCRDYNCRNCTRVFATRQEAEAAGYRPHDACVHAAKGPR
jgi:micrococcal nuclease